jgi:hypothetical protein
MGPADFKKEGRCSDQRNALPKGDPAALPKGDRADVTRFTRGAVLKLWVRTDQLSQQNPYDFSILKPRTDWADPPLIFIRRCA